MFYMLILFDNNYLKPKNMAIIYKIKFILNLIKEYQSFKYLKMNK